MSHHWRQPTNLVEMFRITADRSEAPEWLPDPDGPVLNIGHGKKYIMGAEHLDLPEWDADRREALPYDDGYFSAIYALHFLEHLDDPIWTLREFQRVLRPGGHANIGVPYYNAQCYAQDLNHKHPFCEETWRNLFSNPYYANSLEGWAFDIGANYLIGIVERNLLLVTQLIRQ